ncbi:MAG: tRNA preQ1(34) S-adenosylmethionine ribosyltransferase-isomerase QueA [Patescibacteria group bacterium]|nr:tRNA preQ1(34) S-adenosylmethionine ribosyltransferase-isomerase QueA [Patescibacteria group bacterium]
MPTFDQTLAPYDYAFPPSLIAQRPAKPRDAARLLAFDRKTGKTAEGTFADLPDFLPPGTLLVFNETKVLPARLELRKPTGGRVNVLYIGEAKGLIQVMADRKLELGAILAADGGEKLAVEKHDGRFWFLRPQFSAKRFIALLEKRGRAPLPPYIKHSPLTPSELKREYQAVFAREPGSVAAPTASLHFTKRLLAKLRRRGFETAFVTLHVNLGTFAPLSEEQLRTGRLHVERYGIDQKTAARLNAAKQAGRPIIAVGTTVMRTLESAAAGQARLTRLTGETDLFIREGYRFAFVNGLITNFHVPKSSLLMLVAAFAGREPVRRLYRHAVRLGYRLFSFGDGMLII